MHLSSYQNSARGGLSRDKFPRPVLGLGHEGALEFLLAALRLLFLLFGVVGRVLRFLATAQEGEGAPYQDDEQTGEEGAYA